MSKVVYAIMHSLNNLNMFPSEILLIFKLEQDFYSNNYKN